MRTAFKIGDLVSCPEMSHWGVGIILSFKNTRANVIWSNKGPTLTSREVIVLLSENE